MCVRIDEMLSKIWGRGIWYLIRNITKFKFPKFLDSTLHIMRVFNPRAGARIFYPSPQIYDIPTLLWAMIWNFHSTTYQLSQSSIGMMVILFANSLGDPSSIPGRVIPKTQNMVLHASLLNTQPYKVQIKGKVEQSRERSSALPNTSV